MSASKPSMKRRNRFRRRQNQGLTSILGSAWQIPTYRLCGVRRREGMTHILAFVRNLRTGSMMVREKAQVQPHEAESTDASMHRPGAHCLVGARKRGNARGAKEAGHLRQDGVKGNRRLCQEDARASCCTKDEGRSFEAALQREASNSHKLLQSKAAVVNVMVKRRGSTASCMNERDERK
jgi:hypothetical protein